MRDLTNVAPLDKYNNFMQLYSFYFQFFMSISFISLHILEFCFTLKFILQKLTFYFISLLLNIYIYKLFNNDDIEIKYYTCMLLIIIVNFTCVV